MSRKGVSMRKVREILRLRLGGGLSTRQVADSCRVSVGTVSEYERRARAAGLGWPLPADLDDTGLERIVRARECDFRHNRPLPDASYLITEMKRAHVTLHLLWLEYPRISVRWLRLHPVLPLLQPGQGQSGPGASPGAQGRRKAIYRLRR